MKATRDIFHNPSYQFHPALVLDGMVSPRTRHIASMIFGLLALFTLVANIVAILVVSGDFSFGSEGLKNLYESLKEGTPFLGTFFIFFPIWLFFQMLGWFRNSYYYHVEALLERGEAGAKTPYTTPNYETNEIFFHTHAGDLLGSFLASPHGMEIVLRSGLKKEDVKTYLSTRTARVDFSQAPEIDQVFTLRDVTSILLACDPAFASFVFSHGVRPEDLSAASEWVERRLKQERRKTRTWGRVALGKTRGIGSDLSQGVAYALERYSHDLTRAVVTGHAEFRHLYGTEVIAKVEAVLSRAGGNVVLVGPEGGALLDVVIDFAHDVMNGYTHSRLSSSHLMLLDWKRLLSGMRTKQELELRIQKMMDSAVQAKGIIVVIDDYAGFFMSAQTLGVDIVSAFDVYAASGRVAFITTAEMGQYHTLLEQNGAFHSRFETILVPEPEKSSLTRTLEDATFSLERTYHILFTYPAVRAVREGAVRYFVDAVMPQTALSLLAELAPLIASRGDHTIGYEDVMNYIQAKTQIPVGTITDDERKKLEHMEEELHLHVIGQEKALQVIANALRRSRAGVRNLNKPIGTFLFLGPTGVGKTEVAKALARVFFGDEVKMVRFDMSEFQSEDGLPRLIGGIGNGSGVLSDRLREHPYGVVLLDEFEKTHPKVLDLFLQIFDEGVFHDAGGKKVNGQNTIMIATSNAGAGIIREAVNQGLSLDSIEKQIIDGVIAEGKYKPELLNRFDAIVIFHPLTQENYRQVALLMVEKLRKRLRQQNIDIAVNDVVLDALLLKGVDPDFGARPMNRAVQELLEQTIATKIINGEVKPGMTVTFRREDFPEIFPSA